MALDTQENEVKSSENMSKKACIFFFFFTVFNNFIYNFHTYNTYATMTLTFTLTIYLLIILLILTPLIHALLNNTIPMAYTYLQYL